MDASDVLLAQWTEQVKQIWSGMHQYRQEGMALAVLGIVLASKAVIQRVAETLHERLSNPSKMSSYERQMQRLIDNEGINVTDWWERFLQHALPYWDTRRATLVLDCTPYNNSFTIVFVGILVQKRLLPLAWEIMPQTEKWEESQWSIVDRLFEETIPVFACQAYNGSGRSWLDSVATHSALCALSLALCAAHEE